VRPDRTPAIPNVRDVLSCQDDKRQGEEWVMALGDKRKDSRHTEDQDRPRLTRAGSEDQSGHADCKKAKIDLAR